MSSMNMFLILVVGAICLGPLAGGSPAETSDDFPDGEMVCSLTPQMSIDSINTLYGTTTSTYISSLGSYLLHAPSGEDVETLAAEINARPDVVYCHPNYFLDAPESVQSSQPFLDEMHVGSYDEQEATKTINLDGARLTSTGQSVTVGIVDAGVNLDHPALEGTATSGFDYIDYDGDAAAPASGSAAGHGTFVAGIVHLVAPASESRSYRVLDSTGRGSGFAVAKGITAAVDDGCKVINVSLVMSGIHETVKIAIEYARNNNALVIAAAGNDSTGTERFPANHSSTLAVAAVDSVNRLADFSNYGGTIDICAPGTMIYSTLGDSSYGWWSGTSFAAPFVAGQASLLYAAYPGATWNDIVNAITSSATDLEPLNPGLDGQLGSGLINLDAALQTLLAAIPCGDLDGDGEGPDVSDLSYLIDFLFRGGSDPVIPGVADINGDTSKANLSDLTYLIDYLFRGGSEPSCGS